MIPFHPCSKQGALITPSRLRELACGGTGVNSSFKALHLAPGARWGISLSLCPPSLGSSFLLLPHSRLPSGFSTCWSLWGKCCSLLSWGKLLLTPLIFQTSSKDHFLWVQTRVGRKGFWSQTTWVHTSPLPLELGNLGQVTETFCASVLPSVKWE